MGNCCKRRAARSASHVGKPLPDKAAKPSGGVGLEGVPAIHNLSTLPPTPPSTSSAPTPAETRTPAVAAVGRGQAEAETDPLCPPLTAPTNDELGTDTLDDASLMPEL